MSLSASCARAMREKTAEDALDTVISCVACECAYDGDERAVARRLGTLERAIVLRALDASRAPLAVLRDRILRRGARRWFVGVEASAKGAANRAVVLETCDAYYYAFGGTQTTRDLISDANYWMSSVEDEAKAHRGFLARAETVAADVMFARARARGKRLVMCGHSLGGATAALATVILLLRRPEAAGRVRCVTFAMPPVGDESLSRLVVDRRWTSTFTHICAPEDRISRLLLSRPGYVHFVRPKYLLEDGRIVMKELDVDDDDALQRVHRDSAGFMRAPRSVVYVHAMKTYRDRLMLTLRSALSSFDADAFVAETPRAVPMRSHLGPEPTLKSAVGVLARDGGGIVVLVRGTSIDTRTCSRTRAEAKGWLCSTTATVLGSDSLIVAVSPPALHGAPLPSDAVCSPGNHASWMPLVVGVGGDFSLAFVNVRIIPRVVIFVRSDASDASWIALQKSSLQTKQTGWIVKEVGPLKRKAIDGFVESSPGCVCVMRAVSDGLVVREGGRDKDAIGMSVPADDVRAVEKSIRAALQSTEMDALEHAPHTALARAKL